MAKKDNNIINNQINEVTEYKKLGIIIFIILIVFLGFYLITSLLTKENNDDIFNNELETTEIQYNEIIVGNMFDKTGEYYVLLKNKKDPYLELFETYIESIRKGETKIYTVDLSSAFNKKYIAEESNFDKENFKVKDTTLLKLKDGEIIEHYELKEDIQKKLGELVPETE